MTDSFECEVYLAHANEDRPAVHYIKDHEMTEYEFTVILASPEESEDDANRLYEAGCADGSICTSGGVTRIDFHRQASTLEEAIRSAIGNVHAAGFHVAHILIEPGAIVAAG